MIHARNAAILVLLLIAFTCAWSSDNETHNAADSTKLVPIKTKKAAMPAAASINGIQGQVVLKFDVTETGDVDSIEIVSGHPILAEAAVDALKKWKFKPFIKNGKAARVSTKLPFDFFFSGHNMKPAADVEAACAPDAPAPARSDAPRSDNTNSPTRVTLGQGIAEGLACQKIAPVYPPEARQGRIEGTVKMRGVIARDGRILDLTLISGPKQLVQAAMGAVQQWRYRPYMVNGSAVEVETEITVNFRLAP